MAGLEETSNLEDLEKTNQLGAHLVARLVARSISRNMCARRSLLKKEGLLTKQMVQDS
jgi:hypothetical protein